MMMNDSNEDRTIYKVIDAKKTGEFIRQLRKERGMTQDELGEKIFISRKSISKWETGCCTPSIDMLKRLSEVLGVSLEELVIGEFKEKPEATKKDILHNEFILKIIKNRWFKVSGIGICVIALVLLVLLVINSFNSDKIYLINHEGDTFTISNGTITLAKGKSYINVGEIFTNFEEVNDNTKYRIDFYRKDDSGEEHLIVSFKDTFSMHLDDEIYQYLKEWFNKKEYDNFYFKLSFDGVSGKEYKYELNLKITKKFSSGGNDSKSYQKQFEKEIEEVNLNFLFDMSLEDIKKKFDNKRFKIDGVEWKISWNNNTLEITSQKNKIVYIVLTQSLVAILFEDINESFSVENGKITFENVDQEIAELIEKLIKKMLTLS